LRGRGRLLGGEEVGVGGMRDSRWGPGGSRREVEKGGGGEGWSSFRACGGWGLLDPRRRGGREGGRGVEGREV